MLYFPDVDPSVTAIVIIVLFGIVNCFGLKAAATLQNIIVGVLILAMALFVFGGIPHYQMENLVPLFPLGAKPVIEQFVPGYFGFIGLFTITEWAGEIKNPQKTLPRALFISMSAITLMYVVVSIALCAMVNYTDLGVEAAVGVVATKLYPAPIAAIINLGAIFATASTLNGMMVVLSREISSMSSQKMLPKIFSRTNRKNGAPFAAVLFVIAEGALISLISDSVLTYIDVETLFIMLNCIHAAIASLLIKKALPTEYENAPYKLKGFWYYFWPLAVIISCGFVFFLSYLSVPQMTVPMLVILAAGVMVYMVCGRRNNRTTERI